MDTGDHQIPIELQHLREKLSMRQDGYWGLLAASAGMPSALASLLIRLSTEQLDKATLRSEITPSLVREHVEALAAFDTEQLIELTDSWRPPSEIRGDPFWQAAWSTALRHLRKPELLKMVAEVPELAAEVAALAPADVHGVRSWSELAHEYKSRFIPYETVRGWARIPLSDRSIGVQQVKPAPLLMLRVLRTREQLLDPAARNQLRSAAGDVLKLDSFEAALLLEIVRKFDPNVITAARKDLTELLPGLPDARAVIPLAYVLVSPNWIVP